MQSFSGREIAPPREIGRHPLDLSDFFVGQLVPEPECEDLAQVIGETGHGLVDSVAELAFEKAGLWRWACIGHESQESRLEALAVTQPAAPEVSAYGV